MIVKFTKPHSEDRPPTMTCVRSDGSTCGMPTTPFFVRHDLTHFAVESVLSLTEAFYGLLAKGWAIESFEERQPGTRKSPALPTEAHLAERIVGLFDLQFGAVRLTAEEMLGQLGEVEVTADQIEEMRKRRSELLRRYSELLPGETLELEVSPSAS